jgi:hypothetical protein
MKSPKITSKSKCDGLVGKRLGPPSMLVRGTEIEAFTSYKKNLIILFYIVNKILYKTKSEKNHKFSITTVLDKVIRTSVCDLQGVPRGGTDARQQKRKEY